MGVERGWVVTHHQNFHPHYHHPAHQHPPLPPPLPPPDVDSNYIHAGDDGCEKLIKLEVQEYYRLSSQEFERHALNHHHHYHLHFHPQHLHNHHPHQHQHHHPSDNNNLVKGREHFFHEAGEDSRLPSPEPAREGREIGLCYDYSKLSQPLPPLPPPQQQQQQQPPSSSAPYNHIPPHPLPNDVDDDSNHPSAIATAVKAFNITNGYDDSGLSKAGSLGAGEDRERSPALGPIAAHTTLPSPHLSGYASYPSMSPRGQQCERGMVENAAMGPVTLAASDGDITDHDSIGGRSSVPFDRQCVSHRRGPPLMGGGASGDEQPPGVCAGCGRRIVDRYYLQAVDKQWHVQCLTCSDCHYRLDSELTCFARDGQIYCKEDYYRRFAMKRCSRCHQGISANELVMRARDQVFHLMCFSCTACHRTLTPGEEFGLRDNQVYCRTDYELMFQGDYIPSLSPGIGGPAGLSTHSPNPNGPIPFYNGVGAVQKGRPRKRKSPLPDGDGCTNMGLNGLDMSDRPGDVLEREGYGHTPPRQKRVRTSFKHHQLRTMKSYFALNHNPDAKDLKQLAQKTGLSKRVLQVWFQNARAKYRRNLLKQQQDADKNGQGAASSPTGGDTNKEREKDASGSLTDLSNTRSPALSDISSTPSLSDLQSGAMESGGEQGSSSSISELFSSTIASIN